MTEEHKKKLSIAHRGKKFSEEHRKNLSLNHRRHNSLEHRKKLSEYNKKIEKKPPIFEGERSSNWKGGKTSISEKIRKSEKYKLWRQAIFKRDNFTCIWCGQRSGKLNADHIISFSSILEKLKFEQGIDNLYKKAMNCELLWDVNNGRTLCINCHKNTKSYLNNSFGGYK